METRRKEVEKKKKQGMDRNVEHNVKPWFVVQKTERNRKRKGMQDQ